MVTRVALPEGGFKLHTWKVQNGTIVRKGDLIALAVSLTTKTTTSTAATTESNNNNIISTATQTGNCAPPQQQQQQHKRPTRRKRPVPVAEKINGDCESKVNDTVKVELPNGDATTKSKDPGETIPIYAPTDGLVRIQQATTKNGETVSQDQVIAFIDDCDHPTIVDGLCAVCGIKVETESKENVIDTNVNSSDSADKSSTNTNGLNKDGTEQQQRSQMTVAGLTVSVSKSESIRMALEDSKRLRSDRKLSLVLDLDHTLVHATNDARAEQHYLQRSDVRSLILPIFDEQLQPKQQPLAWAEHFVKLRPYVKDFLEMAMKYYEVGVYTAGTRLYAENVAMVLSRYMVGSKRDQKDLDNLHYQLSRLEEDYRRETHKRSKPDMESAKLKSESDDNTKHGNVSNHAANLRRIEANDKEVTINVDAAKLEEKVKTPPTDIPIVEPEGSITAVTENKKKRKRVNFIDTPSSAKSDHITLEQVENLRQEVQNAMALESKAAELRQKLFGQRVVSRTEVGDLGRDVKSLKRIFPCGGTMAVVLDDREDVWANALDAVAHRPGEPPENMLLVKPYHWGPFAGFADVNNASGQDLSEDGSKVMVTEEESDEQLKWSIDILDRLHRRYYSDESKDVGSSDWPSVAHVLKQIRREALKGCKVVLSGLVPLHRQGQADPNRPRPDVVRYVEQLGAKISSTVGKNVTHVVAAKDGTDKCVAARKIPGCVVVRPSWLMECFWTLTRRNEVAHLLGLPAKALPAQDKSKAAVKSQASVGSSSDDEDDDDDFVADLENEMERTG